jgi:Fur family transcriptional regulator, peroxide stress response regulator
MISFEETIQKLRSEGFKLTPQRLAVIRFMLGNTEHPSALKIHKELRRRYPTLSFSTVYNTLSMLEKIDQVQSLHIYDGFLNYDPNTGPHIHCFCKSCGMISDIMMEGRNDVIIPSKEIEGFQIENVGVVFKGTCTHCK